MLKKLILATALTICQLALCSGKGTASSPKKPYLSDPEVLQATIEKIKKEVNFDNFVQITRQTYSKLDTSKMYSLPLGIEIYCRTDLSEKMLKGGAYYEGSYPGLEKLIDSIFDASAIDGFYTIDITDHIVDQSSIAKAAITEIDPKHKSISIPGTQQHLIAAKTTNAKGYGRQKIQLHHADRSFASPVFKNLEENCLDQNADKVLISKCGKFLVVQFSNFNAPNDYWNSYKYSFYKKRNFNYLKFERQIFIQAILNEFAKTGQPVHVPDNLKYMLKALPDKVRNLLFENGYLANIPNTRNWFDRYTIAGMVMGAAIFGVATWYKLI